MHKVTRLAPRMAIFLAGAVAGAITFSRRQASDRAAVKEMKDTVAALQQRLEAQEAATAERLAQVQQRLDEHAAKLSEVPTAAQFVTAMEQLLNKTMASLDERLTNQAHSIEILKTTVSQTDNLLERVLESLDSLQTLTENSELPQDTLLRRPA